MIRFIAAVVSAALLLAAPVAANPASLVMMREELRRLELENELRLRRVPPASECEALLGGMVRARAERAKLQGLSAKAGAVERSGSGIETHRLDVTGEAPYGDVWMFLRSLALAAKTQAIDFTSLRVTAASGERVRFGLGLTGACWSGRAAPDRSARSTPERSVEEALDRERALSDELALLEGGVPGALVATLARFDDALYGEAVALGELRMEQGRLALSGMALGATGKRALLAGLASAALRASPAFTVAGECAAFTVGAPLPTGNVEGDEVVVFNGLFDEQAKSRCAGNPAGAGSIEMSGADAGGVTLRLHDVDWRDVYRAVADLTGHDFVVAGLRGRLSVEVERLPVGDLLTLLGRTEDIAEGEIGLAVAPADGRQQLRPVRVGVGERYEGETIDLSVANASIGTMVCTLQHISGRPISIPSDLRANASVFVSDQPWDFVLASLAAAVPLRYEAAGAEVRLRRQGDNDDAAGVPACRSGDDAARAVAVRDWWNVRPDRLAIEDLVLTGAGRVGGGAWRGFAYSPGPDRLLLTLAPGTELLDGKVLAVDVAGVTFEAARGPLVRSFPARRRP